MNKNFLRTRIKETLRRIDEAHYHKLSRSLSSNLSELLFELKLTKTIKGAFSPIQREPLWYLELEDGHYAVPVLVEAELMSFTLVGRDELVASGQAFGETVDVKEFIPSALLVPGLAFSEKMERLGRGAGFYDRYFERFPKSVKIGLCFECQILDAVPRDEHDVLMNYIVTESRIIRS